MASSIVDITVPAPRALGAFENAGHLKLFPVHRPVLVGRDDDDGIPGFHPHSHGKEFRDEDLSPVQVSFLPLMIREGRRGTVLNSWSGYTPFNRMLVVSTKVLNIPPNLRRGE